MFFLGFRYLGVGFGKDPSVLTHVGSTALTPRTSPALHSSAPMIAAPTRLEFGVWGLGCRLWGVGIGVRDVVCGVWGLGCGVLGWGFGIWGLEIGRASCRERV